MEFAGWWVVVCACTGGAGDGGGNRDKNYEYYAVVEFAESVDDASDGCVWEHIIFAGDDSIESWTFDAGFVFVVVCCGGGWVFG